jgi:hypothetical protein
MEQMPLRTPKEQESWFWRALPTRLLMQLFRHIDKQESPTLTHTVAHVVGSFLLVAIPTAGVIFWRHIPSILSFLFGSQSLLRETIKVELWVLLPLVLVPWVFLWLQLRRVVIHSASYGSVQKCNDVTELMRKIVEKDRLRVIRVANEILGPDPDFGTVKSLTVDYSVWGRRRKKSAQENQYIKLD